MGHNNMLYIFKLFVIHQAISRWSVSVKDISGSDYSDNSGKEVTLDGKSKEKALLYPKKNLFSKNVKLMDCSSEGCEKQILSEEEKRKFDKCNYEGYVESDPDSKVSFNQCNENEVKDITIISDKAKLSYNSYRIDEDGNVDVPQVTNLTDSVEQYDEEENIGSDYSEDFLHIGPPVFLDRNGIAITIMDVNGKCCRASRVICKKTQYKNEKAKSCKVELGKILCEKPEIGSKKESQTCSQLKAFAREKEYIQNKLHTKDKISDKSFQHDYAQTHKLFSMITHKRTNAQTNAKSKQINKITGEDLIKAVKKINMSPKKAKINPKCI